MRRNAMCFEFEYLYWAKLEEEAKGHKEDEQRRQQRVVPAPSQAPSAEVQGEQSQPVPV
jgi:hypothetical protein